MYRNSINLIYEPNLYQLPVLISVTIYNLLSKLYFTRAFLVYIYILIKFNLFDLLNILPSHFDFSHKAIPKKTCFPLPYLLDCTMHSK